jgi:hypothetical protein
MRCKEAFDAMQRPKAILRLLTLAAAGAVSCGRLTDESYRGEPLAIVHGSLSGSAPANGRVLVAVEWLRPSECARFFREFLLPLSDGRSVTCTLDTTSAGDCAGRPSSGARSCRETDAVGPGLVQVLDHEPLWNARLDVRIYGLPPDAAFYRLERQGGRGLLAIGRLVATEDEDGDGSTDYGSPSRPPERAIAGTAVGGAPAPPSPDPVSVYSRFVAFLDGEIEPAGLRATVRPGEPFAPRQGYGIWIAEEVFALGSPIAFHLRAESGGGFLAEVPFAPYPGPDERALWCAESQIETLWLPAIPPGEAPTWCQPDGRAAAWERTTAIGPCSFLWERFRADYSCSPDAPPWAGSCP